MSAVAMSPTVEQRLDDLSRQVAEVAEELRHQREAREQRAELVHELTLVSRGAMDVATRELAELSDEVTVADAARLARTLARALPRLDALVAQLGSLSELAAEVTALSGAGVARLSDSLAEADRRGYFAFARQGAAVVDRVVTNYDEDDVAALGENVVLILDTVRQMTQPEIMTMLRGAIGDVQSAQTAGRPPSLVALARQLNDPQTRRGLSRTLVALHAMGATGTTGTTGGTGTTGTTGAPEPAPRR